MSNFYETEFEILVDFEAGRQYRGSSHFVISEFVIPLFRDAVSGTNYVNSLPFLDFQKKYDFFFSLLQEIHMFICCCIFSSTWILRFCQQLEITIGDNKINKHVFYRLENCISMEGKHHNFVKKGSKSGLFLGVLH